MKSSANTSSGASDNSKVWLITGTSSGFGKRLMVHAIARGDRVIATARSISKLEQCIAEEGLSDTDRVRYIQLDVSDGEEKIKGQMEKAVGFWGKIDVLVNNAGFGTAALMEEGGTKTMRHVFDTNVFGVLDVTNAALPYLRKTKDSCVVVIGSRSAWKADLPGLGFYSASKAAVDQFPDVTETLRSELSPFGIRVLLVEPGAFKTEGAVQGKQEFYLENSMPEYDRLRQQCQILFSRISGQEKGDPNRAVEVIIDMVKGEGVARGKPWTNYLVLGNDAENDLRTKISKLLNALDANLEITRGLEFDNQLI